MYGFVFLISYLSGNFIILFHKWFLSFSVENSDLYFLKSSWEFNFF